MKPRIAAVLLAVALIRTPAPAGAEIGIEVSPIVLLGMAGQVIVDPGTFELQFYWRPDDSAWLFGYKYTQWVEQNILVGDIETDVQVKGPYVRYLFNPGSMSNRSGGGSGYLGAALFRYAKTVTCVQVAGTDTYDTTTPFFGGGYMGRWGEWTGYTIGLLLSPATQTITTPCTSQEGSVFSTTLHVALLF